MKKIVITGAGGFIGSCLVSFLNQKGHANLILVDAPEKETHPNLSGKRFERYMDRDVFPDWFGKHADEISFVFHIGARTDTTERDEQLFERLNVGYSKTLWTICTQNDLPFLYASSAATYGNGALGYSDDHAVIPGLQPLNPYGWSKQKFDLWVLEQSASPTRWAGFKFFNVFGPNEYHKGRMASVILHAYNQIQNTGKVKLFRSNDAHIADGEQRRDFIYVKDLLNVLYYFFEQSISNGIYNLGSGEANTFKDLVTHVFAALEKEPNIEFIPMPEDLNSSYQNYTRADMSKLRDTGYGIKGHAFEGAVREYTAEYLRHTRYF
ncbi:MAG TPA: ADP-glyceromanno-heptose 6-epimerase [Saprospiraceae bacterium]|nr:ADP-glyceromanno-heptose 6-epimerase [Saprospiraceae bacterium]